MNNNYDKEPADAGSSSIFGASAAPDAGTGSVFANKAARAKQTAVNKKLKLGSDELKMSFSQFKAAYPLSTPEQETQFIRAKEHEASRNQSMLADTIDDLSIMGENLALVGNYGMGYLTDDASYREAALQNLRNTAAIESGKSRAYQDSMEMFQAEQAARDEEVMADGEETIGEMLGTWVDTAGNLITSPRYAAGLVAQNADTIVTAPLTMGAGAVAGNLLKGAAKKVATKAVKDKVKSTAAKSAILQAAKKGTEKVTGSKLTAGFVGEQAAQQLDQFAQEGASTGADVYKHVLDMSTEDLQSSEEFQTLKAEMVKESPNISDKEVQTKLAEKLGDAALEKAGSASTGIAALLGTGRKLKASKAKPSVKPQKQLTKKSKEVVGDLGQEGIEEALQEGTNTLVGNVEKQKADKDVRTTEGVAAASATGSVVGVGQALNIKSGKLATGALKDYSNEVRGKADEASPLNPAAADKKEASRVQEELKTFEPEEIKAESDTSLENVAARVDTLLKGDITPETKADLEAFKNTIQEEQAIRKEKAEPVDDEETLETSFSIAEEAESYKPSKFEERFAPSSSGSGAVLSPEEITREIKETKSRKKQLASRTSAEINNYISRLSNTLEAMDPESKEYGKVETLHNNAVEAKKTAKAHEDKVVSASLAEKKAAVASGGKGGRGGDNGFINSTVVHDADVNTEDRKKSVLNTATNLGSRGSREGIIAAGNKVIASSEDMNNIVPTGVVNDKGLSKMQEVRNVVVSTAKQNQALAERAILAEDAVSLESSLQQVNKLISDNKRRLDTPPKKGHTDRFKAFLTAEKTYLEDTKAYIKAQAETKPALKGVDFDVKESFDIKHTTSGSVEGNALADDSSGVTLTPRGRNSVFKAVSTIIGSGSDVGNELGVSLREVLTEDEVSILRKEVEHTGKSLKKESSAKVRKGILDKVDAAIRSGAIQGSNIHDFIRQADSELFQQTYQDGTTVQEYATSPLTDEEAAAGTQRVHNKINLDSYDSSSIADLLKEEKKLISLLGSGSPSNSLAEPKAILSNVKALAEQVNDAGIPNKDTTVKSAAINPYGKDAPSKIAKAVSILPDSLQNLYKASVKQAKMVFRLKSPMADLTNDKDPEVYEKLYLNISDENREKFQKIIKGFSDSLAPTLAKEKEFATKVSSKKGEITENTVGYGFLKMYKALTSGVENASTDAPFQKLLYTVNPDGSLKRNEEADAIVEAVMLSAVTWAQTAGSQTNTTAATAGAAGHVNSKADVKNIVLVTPKGKEFDGGNTKSYVTESLGSGIMRSMGIKVGSSDIGMESKFVMDLGNYAYTLLSDMGVIQTKSYGTSKNKTGTVITLTQKAKADNKSLNLVTVAPSHRNKMKSIEGSKTLFNNYLTTLTDTAYLGSGVHTEEQVVRNKHKHEFSTEHQKAVDILAGQNTTPDMDTIASLVESYDSAEPEVRDSVYRLVGLERDSEKLIPIRRNTNEENKRVFEESMDILRTMRDNPDDFTQLYQRLSIASSHRNSQTSGFGWQGSKLLARAILAGFESTVSMTDVAKDIKTSDGTPVTQLEAFKVAVARMFDEDKKGFKGHIDTFNDKFGIDKRNQTSLKVRTTAEQNLNREVALLAHRYVNNGSLSDKELSTLLDRVGADGHGTTSLYAYASAGAFMERGDADSFTFKGYREDDGIANGVALAFATSGLATGSLSEMVERATSMGFNVRGMATLQDLRNAADNGGEKPSDVYTGFTGVISEGVLAIPSTVASTEDRFKVTQLMETILSTSKDAEGNISIGDLAKELRNMVKDPLMRLIYGSGAAVSKDSISLSVVDKLIDTVNGYYAKYKSDPTHTNLAIYKQEVSLFNARMETLSRLAKDTETGAISLNERPQTALQVHVDDANQYFPVFNKSVPFIKGKRKGYVAEVGSNQEVLDVIRGGVNLLISDRIQEEVSERMQVVRAMLDTYSEVYHTLSKTYVSAFNLKVAAIVADKGFISGDEFRGIADELQETVFKGIPTSLSDSLGRSTIKAWTTTPIEGGVGYTAYAIHSNGHSSSSYGKLKDSVGAETKVANSMAIHSEDAARVVDAVLADQELSQVFDGFIQRYDSNIGTQAANEGVNNLFAGSEPHNFLKGAQEAVDSAWDLMKKEMGAEGSYSEAVAVQNASVAKSSGFNSQSATYTKEGSEEEMTHTVTPEMQMAIIKKFITPAQAKWSAFLNKLVGSVNQYGDVFEAKVGMKDSPAKAADFFAGLKDKENLPPEIKALEAEYKKVMSAFATAVDYRDKGNWPTDLEGWNTLLKSQGYSPLTEEQFNERPKNYRKAKETSFGKKVSDEVETKLPTTKDVNSNIHSPSGRQSLVASIDAHITEGIEKIQEEAIEGQDVPADIDKFLTNVLSSISKYAKYRGTTASTFNSFKDHMYNTAAKRAEEITTETVAQADTTEESIEQAQEARTSEEGVTPPVEAEPVVNNPIGKRGSREDTSDEFNTGSSSAEIVERIADARMSSIRNTFSSFVNKLRGTHVASSDEHVSHLTNVVDKLASAFDHSGHVIHLELQKDLEEEMEAYGEVSLGSLMSTISVTEPKSYTGSSMAQNSAEVMAHELSHPLWAFALRNRGLGKSALDLYNTVARNPKLDYTVFMDPAIAHPSANDIALAKKRFKYIFGNGAAKGKDTTSLEEFLAYATTNEMFRKNLSNIMTKVESPTGFWKKLSALLGRVVDFVIGESGNYAKGSSNVKADLDKLFLQTQTVLNKSNGKMIGDTVVSKVDSALDNSDRLLGKLAYKAAPNLTSGAITFAQHQGHEPNLNGLSRAVADAIRTSANKNFSTLNPHVKGFFSNVLGKKDVVNAMGRWIEKGTAAIDAVARRTHSGFYQSIHSQFKTEPTKQEHKDLGTVIGRTDLGLLLDDNHSMEEVISIIEGSESFSKARRAALISLRRAMGESATSAKEKALLGRIAATANYMVHENQNKGVYLQNASQVVLMTEAALGNTKVKVADLNPDVVAAVDKLITLDALNEVDMGTRLRVASMARSEESSEGVAALIGAQNAYRNYSRNEGFVGQEHLMVKGHLTQLTNQDKDVMYNSIHAEKEMARQGYRLAKRETMSAGTIDTKKVIMGVYVRNFSSVSSKSNSALYSVTNHRVGESIEEILAITQQGKDAAEIVANLSEVSRRNQTLLNNETVRMSQGKQITPNSTSGLLPIPTTSASTRQWRTNAIDTAFKEEYLDLGYDYIESLSKGMAHVEYKKLTPAHNMEVVEFLREEAKGYSEDPHSFVQLPFDHADIADQINQLDGRSKAALLEAFPSEVVTVKASQLLPIFGYRKWSPLEMEKQVLPPKGQRTAINTIYTAANNLLVPLFNNALVGRLHYIQHSAVKEIAKAIVIKGMSVIKNNILSNIFISMAAGMTPSPRMIKDLTQGWKMAGDYTDMSNQVHLLTAQIKLEEGKGKAANQRKVAMWNRELNGLNNRMEQHEIRDLVDAGYLTTVTTELDTAETLQTSGKGIIRQKANPLLNRTGLMGKALKEAYATEDSAAFRSLQDTMVHSEFGFKYALDRHLARKNQGKAERHAMVDRIFFNYGLPSAKFVDALEGLGFIMFPKFALQAVNAAAYTATKHPSRFLMDNMLRNTLFPAVGGFEDSAIVGGANIGQLMQNPYSNAVDLLSPTFAEAAYGASAKMVGQ